MVEKPPTSTGQLARTQNISQSTAWRILHDQNTRGCMALDVKIILQG